jgi:uncharacterized protein with GYD domain
MNWTDQGVRTFKETVGRVDVAKQAFKKFDVEIKNILWTIGEYDLIAEVKAPTEEALAAALLQLGSVGNIRTKTMRALNTNEMERVIEKVS